MIGLSVAYQPILAPRKSGIIRSLIGPAEAVLLRYSLTDGVATITTIYNGATEVTYMISEADYATPETNLVPPVLIGLGEVGSELSVTPGLWLVDPVAGLSAMYQWTRDGTTIPGANGISYTPTAADEGSILACVETVGGDTATTDGQTIVAAPVYTPPRVILEADNTLIVELIDEAGDADIVVSLDGIPIGQFIVPLADYATPETNLVPPVLIGLGEVGSELSVTPGLWLVDPVAGLSAMYQWTRDGTTIPGANGISYTPTAADEGSILACVETVGSDTATTDGQTIVG